MLASMYRIIGQHFAQSENIKMGFMVAVEILSGNWGCKFSKNRIERPEVLQKFPSGMCITYL